jgi:hypothetical protein
MYEGLEDTSTPILDYPLNIYTAITLCQSIKVGEDDERFEICGLKIEQIHLCMTITLISDQLFGAGFLRQCHAQERVMETSLQ